MSRGEVKVVISAPTGMGKSMIAMIVYDALTKAGLSITVDQDEMSDFDDRISRSIDVSQVLQHFGGKVPVVLMTTNENFVPKKRPVSYRQK